MYENFYHFTATPFLLTPDSRFFFGSKGHSKAIAHLNYGLAQGEGFIVVTGEVGAGKTTLVEWLRSQLALEALPLVVYSGRDLGETEMGKLRLGPTDFLTKSKVQPSEVEELVLNIVQHLRPASPRPVKGGLRT